LSGPLEGLRVLDLSRLLPGGYATLMLADLGADVVKVEEPGRGDYARWMPPMAGEYSAAHVALNRNKRSMTLNLKSPEGRNLLVRLLPRFDVLIESFRPGVMERLGLGWTVLHAASPGLIYCAVSGYGQDGPRAGEAGHDINYIGYAGILGIVGEPGSDPVPPGVQIADLAGGGMNAVISILAALHRRSATGEGDFCDVSMTDGSASWMSMHAGNFVATGEVPRRGEMALTGAYPCYRVYPAADGHLAVGALEPQFWAELCDALDRPDLVGDGFALGERRDEVVAELDALFSKKTRAEWLELLAGRDVCVGPVNDLAEAVADRQLRHREMFVDAEVGGIGRWTHVGNPIRLAGAPGRIDRLPPPRLGEHTAELLAEIGVDEGSLEDLRSAEAI
jgi:crotonobetainyl-CoA:carnitine CoA-transferase CaiB-like acyl-CoA transferase